MVNYITNITSIFPKVEKQKGLFPIGPEEKW